MNQRICPSCGHPLDLSWMSAPIAPKLSSKVYGRFMFSLGGAGQWLVRPADDLGKSWATHLNKAGGWVVCMQGPQKGQVFGCMMGGMCSVRLQTVMWSFTTSSFLLVTASSWSSRPRLAM